MEIESLLLYESLYIPINYQILNIESYLFVNIDKAEWPRKSDFKSHNHLK